MKNKKTTFLELLKTKKVTGVLSIASLAFGIFFIGQKIITGNIIFNSESSLNLTPILGVLLMFCSVILGLYSLKNK